MLDKVDICTESKLIFGHFCFALFIWKTVLGPLFSKYFSLHKAIEFSQQLYKEQTFRDEVRKPKYRELKFFSKLNYS